MKSKITLTIFLLLLQPAGVIARVPDRKDKMPGQQIERTVAADSAVTVSLCLMSGSVTVHGWDRNEVLARSSHVNQIELKRVDGPNQSGPARKLTVLLEDKGEDRRGEDDCQAFGDVELMIPRGASVYVQTGDGAINVFEVAAVYARSQSGDIEVEKASRSVEAAGFSSDIAVKDSTGRVSLKSVGGSVTASGLSANDAADSFEASTISGEIKLDAVAHSLVNVRTVNGNVHLAGPLARAGQYTFNTTRGDVTLSLPSDASFQLNARLSKEAEITSDFPLTPKTEATTAIAPAKPLPPPVALPKTETGSTRPAAPTHQSASVVITVEPDVTIVKDSALVFKAIYTSRRVTAIHSTGDAMINVVSFSGSLRLQKN